MDRRLPPIAATYAVAMLGIAVAPLLLGATADGLGLSESRAGLLTGIE